MPDLKQEGRQDAHALLDRLDPEQLAEVRSLLATMVDPAVKPEVSYREQVSRVPGVVVIVSWRDDRTLHLWSVLAELNEEAARRVYEIEASLQDAFAERFDFYVHVGDWSALRGVLPRDADIHTIAA